MAVDPVAARARMVAEQIRARDVRDPRVLDAMSRVPREQFIPEPQRDEAAWHAIGDVITRNDPFCRGIVLLGLEAPEDELEAAFAAAAKEPQVKGFAVGRTIFNDAARRWLKGEITDEAAVADMAARFQRLVDAWQRVSARSKAA